jgi:hypothetical protein
MTIFGISLFDNSLFEFFRNFISEIKFISFNIVDYLSNTNFYQYLRKIFNKTEILQTKDSIKSSGIIKETIKVSEEKTTSFPQKFYETHKTDEPINSRLSD